MIFGWKKTCVRCIFDVWTLGCVFCVKAYSCLVDYVLYVYINLNENKTWRFCSFSNYHVSSEVMLRFFCPFPSTCHSSITPLFSFTWWIFWGKLPENALLETAPRSCGLCGRIALMFHGDELFLIKSNSWIKQRYSCTLLKKKKPSYAYIIYCILE